MDIHKLKPENVIKIQDLDFYKKGMDFFFQELVTLNVNLYILEKILDFPFYLFTNYGESLFFRMVLQNFFYSSLLLITRITTDQGGGMFTLPRFKNRVRQSVKSDYQRPIDNLLREVKFDGKTQKMLERAKKLRTQKVAHVLEEVAIGEEPEVRFFFEELQQLRDQLNLLLDTLAFDTHYMMLPIQYSPDVIHPKGRDNRSDIEKVLDNIALSSTLLNMPEHDPIAWSRRRENLSNNDFNLLNAYREKFGLFIIEFD